MARVRVPIDLNVPNYTDAGVVGNSFFTPIALTDWTFGHWEFVKDASGKVYGTVLVPSQAPGTNNASIVLAIAANATSGVTRLQVATAAVADAESINPGSLTAETAQDVTVPGTAYLRKDVEFDLTTDPVADDLLIVEVFHDGTDGGDTLAVNTLLIAAWLELDT